MAHTMEELIAKATKKELISLAKSINKILEMHLKDCDLTIEKLQKEIHYDNNRD